MICVTLGTGMLPIPYLFSSNGIILTFILFLIFSFPTYKTLQILIKILRKNKVYNLPELVSRYFGVDSIMTKLTIISLLINSFGCIILWNFYINQFSMGLISYFKEEYANDEDCICYVSDFYIYKKFRNCGIGSYVISELQDILFYYASEVITKTILLPKSRVLTNQRRLQNISDKNQNKELLHSNLIKFYKQNGFEFIKGKDYMWRDEKF